MRSAETVGAAPAGDLTARARIRDAAIQRFAVAGFGVGVRSIAQDAGVSAALILHHFGSKDGLRAACDEHVLASIREVKSTTLRSGDMGAVLLALASMDESAPLLGYALRSLQSGGDLARSFIDQFAADAQAYMADAVAAGVMRPSRDEQARARYLTVQGFGALLLDLTLNPPDDPSDLVGVLHAYLDRTAVPTLELYTEGLLTDTRMLDAYLLYQREPSEPDVRAPG
ncbi:TetR/AcrR family transcriptional regulator [Pengzhenrongella sicca]|nr:TetR family transcriptional regulator [Pengzhenrongella sicca]